MRTMKLLVVAALSLAVIASCAPEGEIKRGGAEPAALAEPQGVATHEAEDTGEAMERNGAEGKLEKPTADKTVAEMRAESLAAIDRSACEAKGGVVEQAGRLGLWRCTVKYTDAGKSCRDGDDCEGLCLGKDVSEGVTEGAGVVGACAASDNPFGCHSIIEDGKIESTRCVD
jgi:hypothetical protein